MECKPILVNQMVLEDTLRYHDEVVLTYHIEYPQFRSTRYQMTLAAMNRLYQTRALREQQYAQGELYQEASRQAEESLAHQDPVLAYQMVHRYQVAWDSRCVLSLWEDRYLYTGGAHGMTLRDSQTWDLQACRTLSLEDLSACGPATEEAVLAQILVQIREEPDLYFPNAEELVAKTFDPTHFYCTSRGVVVYFQEYEIAPYSSGIREFLLPYDRCLRDPRSRCRPL